MGSGGRVKEVHFATVVDNNDPEKKGGIKVRCDTLLEGATLQDAYIPPSFPFAGGGQGFFFVPDKNAQVEIEVIADADRAIESLEARYRAVLYSNQDDIPEEFKSDPTKRAGIKYGDGVLLFDKAKDLLALIGKTVALAEEGAAQDVVRGTQFKSDLDKLLLDPSTSLQAAFAALATASTGPLSPLAAGFGLAGTALTAYTPTTPQHLTGRVKVP